jgi:hypothetical protein
MIDAAIAAGGTHLLVPREWADLLGARPLVAGYLAGHHEMVEASAETGIVFALYPQDEAHPRRPRGRSPQDNR